MTKSITLSQLKLHFGLLVILAIHFVLTGYTIWRMPLAVGPDEAAHFMFSRFLEKEGYLPFSPEEREAAGFKSDQAPLNGALIAAFFWDDINQPPVVKLTADAARRRLVVDGVVNEADRIFNLAVHTEDPLAGEILFWYFGRWMSAIFSGMTLIVIYFTALKIFENLPHSNLWALAAAASVAFIPTFTFMSSVFSYDNLLGLWLALYLLVAIHLLKGRDAWWFFLLAGLLIGLAIVTHLSALIAPLSLALLILIVGYRAGWKKRTFLARSALSLGGLLLGAGWWFILIELKLNKVAELGWIAGLLAPLATDSVSSILVTALENRTPDIVGEITTPSISEWLTAMFKTFWSPQEAGGSYIYIILFITALLILVKLVQAGWQNSEARWWIAFLSAHIIIFLILPFIRLLVTGFETVAGQGRHVLFPAAAAFAILGVGGLAAWFPRHLRQQWLGGIVLATCLLGWNVAHLLYVYPPAVPVPVRTVPPMMPASASPVELDLGPILLQGYELTGLRADGACCDSSPPALGVHLYWLAQEFVPEDYLTTVTLVDSQGQVQSLWMGHGANGRYPTRAWEPGDLVREELYLPVIELPPGAYTLNLEVKGTHSALSGAGNSRFTLTQISLPQPLPLHHDRINPDQEVEVWQEGRILDQKIVAHERSTIQITANPEIELSLVGPDQVERYPVRSAGRTHIFIVDPLWPKGDYRLKIASDNQGETQPAFIVAVQGFERQTRIPDSQVEVRANFANQLLLLGYNMPTRRLAAGEPLPLTLHWQALRTIPTDFIMFTRVRDQAGQVWGGADRWPQEVYSPLLWAEGEVVEDGFTVEIRSNAPDGLYYLDIGFYLTVGQAPISLPLVQDGQMSDVTSVTLGPFKIGDALPDGVTRDQPAPQVALNQPFGNSPNLTLLGYDLTRLTSQSDQNPALQLTLYWRSESPLPADYTTFTHLLNSKGEIVAQKDQPPLNGTYPTGLWQPGEIIADEVVVSLPVTLPADKYCLVVGLYDLNTGTRLNIPGYEENSLPLECDE